MPTYTDVAQRFGDLVAKTDYAAAHALLTKEARAVQTPDDFKEAVECLTSYAPGPIKEVEVMSDFILEDWPDKEDGDVAVIYVSLTGDGFCEAVTLTLTKEGNAFRIRCLEWGRP